MAGTVVKIEHRGNSSSIGEYRRARESSRGDIAENARPDANDQRGKISGARGGGRVARKIANRADLARNHFIFRATMTHRWQTREPYPMIGGVRRKTRRWCVPGFDLKFPISQLEAWLENRPLAACNVATRNTRTLRSFGERTNEPTKMTTTGDGWRVGDALRGIGNSALSPGIFFR